MPKGGKRAGAGRKAGSTGPHRLTMSKAAKTVELVKVTVDRVLAEYAHIGFLDVSQAFDAAGNLLPIHQMPESVRRSIAGIEVADLRLDGDGKGTVGKLHKIKILDKTKALHDMAQHLGMFVERLEHSGSIVLTDVQVRFVEAIDGRPAGTLTPPAPRALLPPSAEEA